MDQQSEPIFPDQKWHKKPADPDNPAWMVFHSNVALHERSNFFLMELKQAKDMPAIMDWAIKHNYIFLGSFDTESEASAYKDFCILQRAKQYTPHISVALEKDTLRNFLVRIDHCDLVKHDYWILITAPDYKLLQPIVPVRPVVQDELENIDSAWGVVMVSNLGPFEQLGCANLHFVQETPIVQNDIPALLNRVSDTVSAWRWLCTHCMKIAAGEEAYRKNIESIIKHADFQIEWVEKIIDLYKFNPTLKKMPRYPKMFVKDTEILYY